MKPIGLLWEMFRDLSVQRGLPMLYYTNNNSYFIFISHAKIVFETIIRIVDPVLPGSDLKDFQDNFKDNIDNNLVPLGDINNNSICDLKHGEVTIGTSAVELKVGGATLPGRNEILAIPQDGDLFWGKDGTVTVANGMPILQCQSAGFKLQNDTKKIFVIAAVNVKVRLTELVTV